MTLFLEKILQFKKKAQEEYKRKNYHAFLFFYPTRSKMPTRPATEPPTMAPTETLVEFNDVAFVDIRVRCFNKYDETMTFTRLQYNYI